MDLCFTLNKGRNVLPQCLNQSKITHHPNPFMVKDVPRLNVAVSHIPLVETGQHPADAETDIHHLFKCRLVTELLPEGNH